MIANPDLKTLIGLIPLLAFFGPTIDDRSDNSKSSSLLSRKNWEKEYDYIIGE